MRSKGELTALARGVNLQQQEFQQGVLRLSIYAACSYPWGPKGALVALITPEIGGEAKAAFKSLLFKTFGCIQTQDGPQQAQKDYAYIGNECISCTFVLLPCVVRPLAMKRGFLFRLS